MVEEIKRTYVIPLRRGFVKTPKYKRTNKAVRVLREFLKKHMKSEDIKIGPALNDLLWINGIKNPPGKVTVDVTKDNKGVVRAELKGIKYVDFKPADKVNKNASFKEKLQSKVATSKENKKEVSKTEKNPKDSKTSKVSTTKTETKETKVKTETKEKEPVKETKTQTKETKVKTETNKSAENKTE